jgi:hypothetical protein
MLHGQFSGPWDFKDEMEAEGEQYMGIIEIVHAGVLPPRSPSFPTSDYAGRVIFINDRLPSGPASNWNTVDQPTFIWDQRDSDVVEVVMVGNSPSHDLFCSGHTFLPYGFAVIGGLNRVLADYYDNGPYGHGGAFVLRTDGPGTPYWEADGLDTEDERWYPTALLLGTKSIMVGGHQGLPTANLDEYRQLFVPSATPTVGNFGAWGTSTENVRELLSTYPPTSNCPANPNFRLTLRDYPRLLMLSSGQVMFVDGESKATAAGSGGLPAGLQQSFFLNVKPGEPSTCESGDPTNPWHWLSGEPAIGSALAQHAGGNVVHLLTQLREFDTEHTEPAPDLFVESIYLIGGTKHGEDASRARATWSATPQT